jgi:hypothetical protein
MFRSVSAPDPTPLAGDESYGVYSAFDGCLPPDGDTECGHYSTSFYRTVACTPVLKPFAEYNCNFGKELHGTRGMALIATECVAGTPVPEPLVFLHP